MLRFQDSPAWPLRTPILEDDVSPGNAAIKVWRKEDQLYVEYSCILDDAYAFEMIMHVAQMR